MLDIEQTTLPGMPVITTQVILKTLREYYSSVNGVLFFDELKVGTGNGRDAQQAIDAWVLNTYPSQGYHTTGYEIKVSRSDFLREIKNPLKRRQALLVSKEFYFIAPEGLIKPHEIPIECGLKEIYWHAELQKLIIKTTVRAPERDISPPSWRFLASIARRADKNKCF